MPNADARSVLYLRSLADELRSQARRVRDLIGNRHWFLDGNHKEELLRGVLRRHSPSGVSWTRGFLVCPTDTDSCSTEQDVLAVDSTFEAPIFSQGDLVIAFPKGVMAAISVKTTMRSDTTRDAISGLSSVRDVAHTAAMDSTRIWCGAYFFEKDARMTADAAYRWIIEGVQARQAPRPIIEATEGLSLGPNMISLADNELFCVDYGLDEDHTRFRVRGFACEGMATAMFLVSVLDHIASLRGRSTTDLSAFGEQLGIKPLEPSEVVASLASS